MIMYLPTRALASRGALEPIVNALLSGSERFKHYFVLYISIWPWPCSSTWDLSLGTYS